MPPEHQTVGKCAELRQDCRDAIFQKMDEQHGIVMGELGGIREDFARRKGMMDLLKAVLPYMIPIGFILVLGGIYWLRRQGWL